MKKTTYISDSNQLKIDGAKKEIEGIIKNKLDIEFKFGFNTDGIWFDEFVEEVKKDSKPIINKLPAKLRTHWSLTNFPTTPYIKKEVDQYYFDTQAGEACTIIKFCWNKLKKNTFRKILIKVF